MRQGERGREGEREERRNRGRDGEGEKRKEMARWRGGQ